MNVSVYESFRRIWARHYIVATKRKMFQLLSLTKDKIEYII